MHFRDTGSDISFEPAPIGNHISRCIRIIDLGTHHDEMYDKDRHQVFFMWEIPAEMKTYTVKGENGAPDKEVTEPFTVSKFYTMSLAESAHLRTDLESWRSKPFTEKELEGFDPHKILGAPCMINVIQKPRKRGNGVQAIVTAITPLPKGIECPPMVHEKIYFSLENFDQAEFDKVSKGLQNTIKQSKEWQEMFGGAQQATQQAAQTENPAPLGADEFDDIPF